MQRGDNITIERTYDVDLGKVTQMRQISSVHLANAFKEIIVMF